MRFFNIDNFLSFAFFCYLLLTKPCFADENNRYQPRGIGGGGALSGLSMSPYANLWFVGSDMGTLFRSLDQGKSWEGINQLQTTFSSDLDSSVSIGFSSNPEIIFHSPGGVEPVRSIDSGKTWSKLSIGLLEGEKIKYWKGVHTKPNIMFCITNLSILLSLDSGLFWQRINSPKGIPLGTFVDTSTSPEIIYHATQNGIFVSRNLGKDFTLFKKLPRDLKIRAFSAGRDNDGITYSIIDNNNSEICQKELRSKFDTELKVDESLNFNCGHVWIGKDNDPFVETEQIGGDFIKMSDNDSQTIYVTGSKKWERAYGTKVWRSKDAGHSWELILHQYNWDTIPYKPWPKEKIDYSAIALDVGWWDNGYNNFEVNQLNSAEIGGTGFFFLYTSFNKGNNWKAPFTKFADDGEITKGKKFKSIGLETTTVYRFKFHPKFYNIGYQAMADIGGTSTDDGGKSFKVIKTEYNSTYDYAFDFEKENFVWAATGSIHDFPVGWTAGATSGQGAIFKSLNKGNSWIRLTPENELFNRQYLSIGFDNKNKVLYAGSLGGGIIASYNYGQNWTFLNEGFPEGDKIIPQIEIDPDNGDVFALITGNYPHFSNQKWTGIYMLKAGTKKWKLLRGNIIAPNNSQKNFNPWFYPTSFAIDFSKNSDRKTLWLVDYENNSNWLETGIWKSTDKGENWERVMQFTHPLSISLNPQNSNQVFVSGLWNQNWGEGGAIYTLDGGKTWRKNLMIPYQHNTRSVTFDPSDESKMFYTFFGNGMLFGKIPI